MKSIDAKGILLDLDGTLLDTAPDMVAALRPICHNLDVPAPDFDFARAFVSMGAAGLLRAALPQIDESEITKLIPDYLDIYADNIANKTILFDGMAELLGQLEADNIAWGVVTNKPAFLTKPLLRAMHLYDKCACVISGDTTAQRKPSAEPLLLGLQQAGLDANKTMYVGDAERDIQAGRNAGMLTVAALYGYILPEENPADWKADYKIDHPGELLGLIKSI